MLFLPTVVLCTPVHITHFYSFECLAVPVWTDQDGSDADEEGRFR